MNELWDDDNELSAELAVKKKESSPETEGQLIVDVFQEGDDIVIQSIIAGVLPDNIDISITNDMVTLRGKRSPESRVKSSDYLYQELYWGNFSRSIILPVDIDADNAKATMKNGVLTIRMPRLDRIRTKKIKVSE